MKQPTVVISLIALALLTLSPFHVRADDDAPATAPAYDWKPLDKILKLPGTLHADVYTYTIPRTDLEVAVDSMEVPTAAGVQSELNFFRCTCGKTRVVGQLCCCDYEANDVIDALRAGNAVTVANVGPMFMYDRPRLTIVRFQGEGEASGLAAALKRALDCTGDNRTSTQPAKAF
jgi:hypothetical protein